MVVLATPVLAADGSLIGHVQAGVLLNRNLAFIDHINEIVYPGRLAALRQPGHATLFLDDVRISTNVRLFGADPGTRAPSARASRRPCATPCSAKGHLAGPRLRGRRLVRVGLRAAGRRRRPARRHALRRLPRTAPFTWLKYGALAAIGLIFFAVMVGAALVSCAGARHLPAHRADGADHAARRGRRDGRARRAGGQPRRDRPARRPPRPPARRDRREDPRAGRWNAELDAKVAERTRALEAAQQQLVRSEKLAAVGQLTASIAHEVNNPIAVIQGNLDRRASCSAPMRSAWPAS